MDVPYTVDRRPDTGFYNAQLGMWLFLASEVMLFGALFSAYALLRTGAMTWPSGWTRLNAPLGAVNTVLLLVSSGAMAAAVRATRAGKPAPARRLLGAASGLGFLFLVIKAIEYRQHLRLGELPSTDTFLALYYTLTGLHALHLAAGVLLVAWLAGPGAALWRRQPGRYTGRVASAVLYWHFVDAVWICVFILMYLS